MIKFIVERILDCGEERIENNIIKGGVIGKIFTNNNKFTGIYTLERPYTHNGIPNVRNDPKTTFNEACCVPDGTYECILEYSARFKRDLFELKRVYGRSETKFHAGNHIRSSDGCPLVGKRLINNVRDPASNFVFENWLSESRKAETELLSIFPKDQIFLIEFRRIK